MVRSKCIVAVLALLLWPGLAGALSLAPESTYTQETPGGEYLFVMIAPYTVEKESSFFIATKAREIREIRATYPESGLYRNDGSTTPLWTVDWYAYDSEVHPLDDGIHVVREDGVQSPDTPFVWFYANGVLLKSYTVSDVVPEPALVDDSFYGYLAWWTTPPKLLADVKHYEIYTEQDGYYLIDITTGEVIEERHPEAEATYRMIVLAGGAIGVVACCVLVVSVVRRHRLPSKR